MRAIVAVLLILACSVSAQATTVVPATTAVAAPTTAPIPTCSLPIPLSYSQDLYYVIVVGFSAFLFVGIVFFVLSSLESGNKVVHVLSFLSTITLSLGYFSLYEGFGAYYKTEEDSSCSLIFLGRLVTLSVTLPVVISSFVLFCRVEFGAIIGGVGASLLALFAWTLGSYLTGAQKYVWWTIGTFFIVALIVHLLAISTAAKRSLSQQSANIANIVFIVLTVSLFGYSIIWVIGQTGTEYLAPSTELAWYVFLDAIVHIGVGFALISSSEAVLDASFAPLLPDQDTSSYHHAYGSGVNPSVTSSYAPSTYESRQYV